MSDTSGHPIESAYLSFTRLTSPSYSGSLNSDRYGGYFQDNLPPGDYSLYCSASGYQSRTESPVTVTAGNTTPQGSWVGTPKQHPFMKQPILVMASPSATEGAAMSATAHTG